jgi:hypothetical protein
MMRRWRCGRPRCGRRYKARRATWAHGSASRTRAVEASAIPAGRQTPQHCEIHNVAPCLAGAGEPGLHAALRAEEAPTRAGVCHVVPDLAHRDKEVSDSGPSGGPERVTVHARGRRQTGQVVATRTFGSFFTRLGMAKLSQAHPSLPQVPLAHDGEPEVHGREGMGRD